MTVTRVLAVEDSPTQAEVLRSTLEAEGFAVELARNGAEALELLRNAEFDVVVSDVVMPVMGGHELCRAIKSSPATADLPVILLTSLTDPLEVVNGLESGADNFLRKPYQADQLIGRIHGALRNRELRGDESSVGGIRLAFLEREFAINADRSQMLDLLVSTFEELVAATRELRSREDDLVQAHAEVRRQLEAVDLERNRLRAVVDAVPVPLFVTAADGEVTHASEATARTFGTTPEGLRGHRIDEVVQFRDSADAPIPPERLPHRSALSSGEPVRAGAAFDVFLACPDGTRVPVVLEASPVVDDAGRHAGSVGTAHVLGSLAHHDPLTGLPNHVSYLERAGAALRTPTQDAAVLLLQLDRLDATEAALGHEGTRQLIVDVSHRLRQVFEPTHGTASRSECFLAYLGAGQFGVLLTGLPDSFGVLHLADAARRAVAELQHGARHGPTASVGVALGDGVHEPSQLFAAANAALRRARAAGGDRMQLFGREASQDALERLQLEADLADAVDAGEVRLHYQPEVDLATGELVGLEALARWQHPRLGAIRPDVFIPIAEATGLVLPLGEQLLRRACAEANTWPDRPDGKPLSVAVNVSTVQLRPGFVDEVLAVLADTGLAAHRLMLEVTESAAMAETHLTLPLLDELRGHGVRISLDDFGTGYSSLSLLTQMNLDQLKLDRRFVAGMEDHRRHAVVARSIVALGDSLGIPVLAEGVEARDQAELLHRLGCSQGQGYLFGRPTPAEDVARVVAAGFETGHRPGRR